MHSQQCSRCKREEYIPTHQYVKFDTEVQYLCSECWARFREWFNRQRFQGGPGAPTIS